MNHSGKVSFWHARLSEPLLPLNSNEGSVPVPCAASDLLVGKCEWGRSPWSQESGVVEVQRSALCLAHIGPLLPHSALSCRVMDLLPAACGTGCTESAQGRQVSTANTKHLKYIQANIYSLLYTIRRNCSSSVSQCLK